MNFKEKKILIGITASIAAYKTYDAIRFFRKEGARVRCMISADANYFVSPVTIEALTGERVYDDLFKSYSLGRAVHIDLAEWADIVCVVPATADMLAKAAAGICDDIVLATVLAAKAHVVYATAMHYNM